MYSLGLLQKFRTVNYFKMCSLVPSIKGLGIHEQLLVTSEITIIICWHCSYAGTRNPQILNQSLSFLRYERERGKGINWREKKRKKPNVSHSAAVELSHAVGSWALKGPRKLRSWGSPLTLALWIPAPWKPEKTNPRQWGGGGRSFAQFLK